MNHGRRSAMPYIFDGISEDIAERLTKKGILNEYSVTLGDMKNLAIDTTNNTYEVIKGSEICEYETKESEQYKKYTRCYSVTFRRFYECIDFHSQRRNALPDLFNSISIGNIQTLHQTSTEQCVNVT